MRVQDFQMPGANKKKKNQGEHLYFYLMSLTFAKIRGAVGLPGAETV